MSDSTVRGIVHLIEEIKTYGKNDFRKRLVVLEQASARFTNYIPLDFVYEACETVDDLSVGDEVEVSYRLSGRKWQRDANSEVKFFLNAEATSFKILNKPGGEKPPAEIVEMEEPYGDQGAEDDEVPF
jgi:hypothetical protein